MKNEKPIKIHLLKRTFGYFKYFRKKWYGIILTGALPESPQASKIKIFSKFFIRDVCGDPSCASVWPVLRDHSEATTGGVSYKKLYLKISQYFTEKHLCWTSVLKETPTQLFFCEYCEIFKNNYFGEHLRTALPVVYMQFFSLNF